MDNALSAVNKWNGGSIQMKKVRPEKLIDLLNGIFVIYVGTSSTTKNLKSLNFPHSEESMIKGTDKKYDLSLWSEVKKVKETPVRKEIEIKVKPVTVKREYKKPKNKIPLRPYIDECVRCGAMLRAGGLLCNTCYLNKFKGCTVREIREAYQNLRYIKGIDRNEIKWTEILTEIKTLMDA